MKTPPAKPGRWPLVISGLRTRERIGSHPRVLPNRASRCGGSVGGIIWKPHGRSGLGRSVCWLVALILATGFCARAASLTGSFASIPQGADVNLTAEGSLDWVHWGLYTETSLDRKAGATPLISDFTILDATNGYAYVYQFADNYNGYSWNDGTPTASVTNTPTGVWAYGVPLRNTGFQFTVPADTTLRTLRVYVGAFAARGELEASLSDNSASAYSNSSLANMGNGPSGVYSISYAAQSAGQTLTIKWTLTMQTRPDANVTLQAAALSVPGANSPPTISITNPTDNATVSAGSSLTLSANVADIDGNVALVEFFQSSTKLGESTNSPFNFTWVNVPKGAYQLTAKATDNDASSTVSTPVEIFVNGTGGSLAGGVAFPPTSVDLTAEGTLDWTHWGLISPNSFDHKTGVSPLISNFTQIGTNKVQRYSDNFTAFDWADGTPTTSGNGTKTGVFISGLTNGFLLTAPADTNSRTLKVYVGLYGAQGHFQAYLGDFSAPAYSDTSLSSVFGSLYAVYTLNYTAASAGQTLAIKYSAKTLFDADYGNVTLQAATLAGASVSTNAPPTVSITNPTNNAAFAAPASIAIQADASDADGTVSNVEFYSGATLLGTLTNSPYTLNWNSVPAGNYTLTARATDNLGGATTSTVVNIAVTNSAAAAVTIINPIWDENGFSFSFATSSGPNYAVEYTEALVPALWVSLTNFTGNGTTVSVTNMTTAAEGFYRVGAQ